MKRARSVLFRVGNYADFLKMSNDHKRSAATAIEAAAATATTGDRSVPALLRDVVYVQLSGPRIPVAAILAQL